MNERGKEYFRVSQYKYNTIYHNTRLCASGSAKWQLVT